MTVHTRRDVLLGLGAVASLAACGRNSGTAPVRKLGVAIVGIGAVSTRSVLPALGNSGFCRLAGLVSSDAGKLRMLGEQFEVAPAARYSYADFDRIADNSEIDLVYIAVPNALHAEYTIRAARAGKHVLCEKPMAVTVEQCESMIAACEQAKRSLAVAYRLHYSPHHQEMLRTVRHESFGRTQLIRAQIGYPLREKGGWRLKRALAGGGVLLEQGVYPVNSARTLAGADPVEVLGYESKSDTRRFAEVDETVSWTMRFADDTVAHCAASYTVPASRIWVGSASGWVAIEEAYSADKIRVRNAGGSVRIRQVDQFALQFDGLARLIQQGQPPGPGISAQDGLRDVRIISAIYESMRTRKVVQLRHT